MLIERYYNGMWMPYQYFSANCYTTFGKTESESAYFENENEALCTSKYSKITPLTEVNIQYYIVVYNLYQ